MEPCSPQLLRAIGRWSLVALAINSIIGSGIFGLPSVIVAAVGGASPWVVLVAGMAIAVIIACYAEVASQFTASGGTYLYVRHALGRLMGLQAGWLGLLARLTAGAAGANLLVVYLGQFWPEATQPAPRFLVITLLLAILTAVNCRGVGAGTRLSNVFTIAKLLPLVLLCAVGTGYLAFHTMVPVVSEPAGLDNWLKAVLVLFFAYGGLESALNPMAEAKDPRRDAPYALFAGLGIVALLYVLLQLIVVGILPDAARSTRPLADVAAILLGPAGAGLITVGVLVSTYGFLSGQMLTAPRYAFAMAEHGDLPRALALIHPRFSTPYVSIILLGSFIWVFALWGSFAGNATLSAAARLFYYAAVCAAVPVLRNRQPQEAAFRVPGGKLLPALGVTLCVVLATRVDFSNSMVLATTVLIALLNWLVVRNRSAY